jgi:hypothetical protein
MSDDLREQARQAEAYLERIRFKQRHLYDALRDMQTIQTAKAHGWKPTEKQDQE